MLLHLIADYGLGDLAFAEVRQRLGMLLPDAVVVVTSVGPFDTLGAGFCIGQLALNDGPQDMEPFPVAGDPQVRSDTPTAAR